MDTLTADVLVIGGGIGGLSTAYRCRQRALAQGRRPDIAVLEASHRWGGVIATSTVDGCLIEHGPDSIIRSKPAGLALIEDLGLSGILQPTAPTARASMVACPQGLVRVPDGLYLFAPGRILPWLASPIMGWRGKLRMALDLVLPRRRSNAPDESLAAFVRRRLGREALDRLAQPLVGGIYTADPETLSMAATMPQFLTMEREHRSLILAACRRNRDPDLAHARGPRYSLFTSLEGGLGRLVDALVAALADAALHLASPAIALSKTGNGYAVTTADGPVYTARNVVLALPGPCAARLLGTLDGELAQRCADIPYAGVATINAAWHAGDIDVPGGTAGMVVPHSARRSLIACTFSSAKYAGRTPEGMVLLRAFAGGAMGAGILAQDDAALAAAVIADLAAYCPMRAPPRWTRVSRYPAAMAQYTLGHEARRQGVRSALLAWPGLFLVSNALEGVGIPDLIAQADAVASRVAQGWSHGTRPHGGQTGASDKQTD